MCRLRDITMGAHRLKYTVILNILHNLNRMANYYFRLVILQEEFAKH